MKIACYFVKISMIGTKMNKKKHTHKSFIVKDRKRDVWNMDLTLFFFFTFLVGEYLSSRILERRCIFLLSKFVFYVFHTLIFGQNKLLLKVLKFDFFLGIWEKRWPNFNNLLSCDRKHLSYIIHNYHYLLNYFMLFFFYSIDIFDF